jgi:hypothetical protein
MMLKKLFFSPARPESVKTASSPIDAPFPMRRSRIVQILNVPHLENKLSWQLGWAGEKCHASALHSLRPCWTAFLSILRGCSVLAPTVQIIEYAGSKQFLRSLLGRGVQHEVVLCWRGGEELNHLRNLARGEGQWERKA